MNAHTSSALAFIRGFEAMIRAMEYCSIAKDQLSHQESAVTAAPDGGARFDSPNGAVRPNGLSPSR
mgnify:CR=1 FL=1